MSLFFKLILSMAWAMGLVMAAAFAQAIEFQTSASELAFISEQRIAVNAEKKAVHDLFQETSKACWKKFAVNDCLANARLQKFQSLAPLDQREVQLNARQRALKEIDRQQRLEDKLKDRVAS